jgi:FkbM family methyltransferase
MVGPMRKLITSLSRSALLRRVVRGLRLHKLGNAWLRRFPSVRRLPESGVVYRARRLESIPLAHEMFERGSLYHADLLPAGLTTFADLGCNVGYFTCWLAHLSRGRGLRGLMFDANPEAVEEARWHAQANGLTEVFGLQGILGETSPTGAVDFYLYESNICSTNQLPDLEKMGLQGQWTKISVPCVSLGTEWSTRFGEARCHLLKVDIEGSEMRFLTAEQGFLARVDSILLEWHKWRVNLPEVEAFLAAHGFALVRVLEETDDMGTAFFGRPTRVPSAS